MGDYCVISDLPLQYTKTLQQICFFTYKCSCQIDFLFPEALQLTPHGYSQALQLVPSCIHFVGMTNFHPVDPYVHISVFHRKSIEAKYNRFDSLCLY